MTLVISEVSERFGCVVVGDSAVTIGKKVVYGAEKVHYSHEANIGFAIWGNACLDGQRVDELVSSFVSNLGKTDTPRYAGTYLADFLNTQGLNDGRDWSALRGGVHICGYENDVPVLFHVHTGHEPPQPQGIFKLYEDFQDAREGFHLRNGYYRMFAHLFDSMESYAHGLGQLGFTWPNAAIEDRVSFHSIMVDIVAQTLEAAGRVPSVGGRVSAIAFNRDGIQVDKRLKRGNEDFCCNKNSRLAVFCEPYSNDPRDSGAAPASKQPTLPRSGSRSNSRA